MSAFLLTLTSRNDSACPLLAQDERGAEPCNRASQLTDVSRRVSPESGSPGRAPYPHRTRGSKPLVTGDQRSRNFRRAVRVSAYSVSTTRRRPCAIRGRRGSSCAAPRVLAFELAGGPEAARTVMGSARLITPAVSLGAVDTLIEHPAGLTHRLVDAQARAAAGITDGLLRLSGGREDVDDLWQDLDDALALIRLGAVA
jgi:hypothetical protein